jgi:uncharacterized SAM-binding protein YcdF (DUF218 family)
MAATFIIVLGNSNPKYYKERVNRGMESFIKLYNQDNNKTYVIMTGGNNESKKMKEYAVKTYGEMYASCILEETKSINTYQNLTFSKQIIDSMCLFYSVIVCTSTFHIDRSLVLAHLVFPKQTIRTIHTRSPIPEDRREREKMLLANLLEMIILNKAT